MSADGGEAWVPTPRRYRPTYTHLASSVSMSGLGSPLPLPSPSRPGGVRGGGMLPGGNGGGGGRRGVAAAAVFRAIEVQHGAATVASSGWSAEAFSEDISHPTPKPHRLSLQSRDRTPTRIPTPTLHLKTPPPMRAGGSSPVLAAAATAAAAAAAAKQKENVLPTSHRLLGPIQPGPAPTAATLTRSRTMNAISNITSTLSRSSHRLVSSRPSFGNLSSHAAAAAAAAATVSTSRPLPPFTTNIRQVSTSMPAPYWLGRFSALHDRFRADDLEPDLRDAAPTTTPRPLNAVPEGRAPGGRDETNSSSPGPRGDERLSKRIFTHLEALCVSHEARKSLKAFQQAYARKFACEALLPPGGTMVDREPGIMAKAGRLFSGGGGGGRKSSFGLARRKSSGVLGLSLGLGLGAENAIAAAGAVAGE